MPAPFRQETRATLRRRVGALLYPSEFRYGSVLSATASSVTCAFAQRLPTGSLKGRVLVVASGTGQGQLTHITDSALGTGLLSLAPSLSVVPDTTSVVEVWPEGIEPERINDALNLAVLTASELVAVRTDLPAPTLDVTRGVCTPPATWLYVMDVMYREATGLWRRYIPTQHDGYVSPCELEYTVVGGKLYLSYPVPAGVLGPDILLRGYRMPQELISDTTLAEANPDFLIYTAALDVDSGLAEGPTLDPEQHATRANAWLRAMLVSRTKLGTDWEPNAVRVRP